ncbi:MAG TPA: hypothetical protein VK489_14235 [Ferruginibacter sp.]|nr:hypothetical protein [Ferruginibacter sp.]
MLVPKLLLLLILGITCLAAYALQGFWKKRIDARRSFAYFLLLILVNLISIFVMVFIFSFLIIHYKEFFFKR